MGGKYGKRYIILILAIVISLLVFFEELKISTIVPPSRPAPRMRIKGLRRKIYESNWIQIFPDLKRMVEVVTDGNPMAITNTKHTSIKLLNSDDLLVGGTLKAIITSYNEAGEGKTYGGDFFAFILRRPGSKTDGVACNITDKMDGSYIVSCILPWDGVAILEARLVNPSETIYQLMKKFSSETQVGYVLQTTMLNSQNKTEKTECTIGFPDARPSDLCDYSNPTHGEKRKCLRPPSGECSKIIDQRTIGNKSTLLLPNPGLHCRPGYNFMQPISGSGMKINIRKVKENMTSYFTGNLSKFSLDPASPTGWRVDGKWTSVKSQRPITLELTSFKACVSNKRIHIFGDSTARYMYKYFIDKLQIKDYGLDNTVFWSRGRDAVSKDLNLTIQYRSHGPPLTNDGSEDARPYMSDSFDAIREGGQGTIVVFTIGYHFEYFDTDVYLERVRIIKQAALSFISRLPGSKVIVKGLHYLSYDGCLRSPWLTYKFDVILRHEFHDIKNIYFMENWDFTLILNNINIHPDKPILQGTIQLLLQYLC